MGKIFYFNITYRCNNDCIFCAADHGGNGTNPEMSLEEFRTTLDNGAAGPGDRVIINGGEPTTHTHFWDFLDIVRERGSYIDLYTNGVAFSNIEFTRKTLEYSPMLIRIPFFGSNAETHDALTGRPGSFDKIVKGVQNILSKRNDSTVKLEIKLLLSKATSEENIRIYNFFKANFKESYYFSLNPLLVSNRVKEQSEIMFEPCTISVCKSLDLIREMRSDGQELSLSLLPFCVLPQELRPDGVDQGISETYSEPSLTKNVQNKLCSTKCKYCYYRKVCSGFPSSYLSFAGEAEVKPIYIMKHQLKEDYQCQRKDNI